MANRRYSQFTFICYALCFSSVTEQSFLHNIYDWVTTHKLNQLKPKLKHLNRNATKQVSCIGSAFPLTHYRNRFVSSFHFWSISSSS